MSKPGTTVRRDVLHRRLDANKFEARTHSDDPYTNTDWRPVKWMHRASTFGETLKDGYYDTVWLCPKDIQTKKGRAYETDDGRLFLKVTDKRIYELREVESGE